ncbi:MAG: 2-oxoacid:acceptor oxidoreductase family protein [Bacteroidales bacterium]
MNEELLIAGFGGQGVLSMGKTLAYAGMVQGKEVSWMPSYGPEMRGGTANVTVIISEERIASPIIAKFDSVIVLNQQSLDKFENSVKPGGLLFFDSNGLVKKPTRKDITIYHIPAYTEAVRLENVKIFNMIVLGAYLKIVPVVSEDYIEQSLFKTLPPRNHNLIPLNMQAFRVGVNIIEKYTP